MLYLKYPADNTSDGPARRIALGEQTALLLECALLCGHDSAQREVVRQALDNDGALSGWALRVAEQRTARTVNHVEEAADWLSNCLVPELATSLENDTSSADPKTIEWRLPALVTKLAECERSLSEFDRRLEHEKLESLKELAYGASHEINNPLANIAARAQMLLDDEDDSERARKLSAIHRQAMRAHEMISDLMLFARPPKLVAKPFDLRELATRVVREMSDLANECGVEISCDSGSSSVEVDADETQIGVALQAVVKNAIEAAGQGGHVFVATRAMETGGPRVAEVCVSDDGPGISVAVRRHMFDPFFSGREAGRGLGFGLSKCWRIVTDHGGEVVVHQSKHGAEICIQLPLMSLAAGPS